MCRKNVLKLGLLFIVVLFISLVGVSYYILGKFTFVEEKIIHGKKRSELTRELQVDLLKNKELEQVVIDSPDNIKLAGFLFRRKNARANLILCHGYQNNKEALYSYIDMFPDFNVLMFDFRAHGQSSGKMISLGCHEYKDVIAATKFMKQIVQENLGKKEHEQLPTIILGISMGGASALKAAEKEPALCQAYIIDSTFSDLTKMYERGFELKVGLPYYPFFPVLKVFFEYFTGCKMSDMRPLDSVQKIHEPIFFIHSCNDSFIPPENSLELYTHALHEKTKIWIGPKCSHGWLHTYYADLYKQKVMKFLESILSKRFI